MVANGFPVGFHGCSIDNRNNKIGDEEMDIEIAKELLRQQTFPRFTIDITRSANETWPGHISVQHQITTVNSYHPDQGVMTLWMNNELPGFVKTPEDFHDWCLSSLIWFAEHETREWFRVDGQMWRDPHHPTAPQPYSAFDMFQRVKLMRPAMAARF